MPLSCQEPMNSADAQLQQGCVHYTRGASQGCTFPAPHQEHLGWLHHPCCALLSFLSPAALPHFALKNGQVPSASQLSSASHRETSQSAITLTPCSSLREKDFCGPAGAWGMGTAHWPFGEATVSGVDKAKGSVALVKLAFLCPVTWTLSEGTCQHLSQLR